LGAAQRQGDGSEARQTQGEKIMEREDDRTALQKHTHTIGIVARDKSMSGWGGATGGASRCAWAVNPEEVNADRVFNWVKARSEMQYVAMVDLRTYRPPRGTAHFHVYVTYPEHPAARY
jgi:hypothetical protein